jgi:nicotinamidase-related amidase
VGIETVRAAEAPAEIGYRISGDLVDTVRPHKLSRAARIAALPQNLLIDAGRSALVIIDMQNDFCHPEGWIGSIGVDNIALRAIYTPINAVTAAARANAIPVLWVSWGVRPDRLNLSAGTRFPFDPNGGGPGLAGEIDGPAGVYRLLAKGGWGAAIVDELEQDPADVHVAKHRISGFWDTPLDSILRNLGTRTVLFSGVNTDQCVLHSLTDANFLGYGCVLVEDCCATTSPDFCTEATVWNVKKCFGFVTDSGKIMRALKK